MSRVIIVRALLLVLLLPGPVFAGDCGFSALCPRDQAFCEEGAALDADVEGMQANPPAKGEKGDRLAALNDRFRRLGELGKSLLFTHRIKGPEYKPMSCVGKKLDRLSSLVLPEEMKDLAQVLESLTARAEALERAMDEAVDPRSRTDEFARQIDELNAEGSRAWERVRQTGRNSDDLSTYGTRKVVETDGKKELEPPRSVPLMPFNNALQETLAALSERLQRLKGRLDPPAPPSPVSKQVAATGEVISKIKDPFGLRDAPADVGVSAGAPLSTPERLEAPLIASGSTLLDMRHPPPPPVKPEQPARSEGVLAAFRALFVDKAHDQNARSMEVRRVEALRTFGLTRTVGDPVGRARLAFKQTGNTCVIAAQVEVLADSGGVPPGADPKALEEKLYRKAVETGYFNGADADPKRRATAGTPGQYVGDLLDMPVRKHYKASTRELDDAVKRGRMLIVTTDTGLLWNDMRFLNKGHAIVVTGAEVDPKTGEVLGYYINDTGTGQGGRLVSARQFREAWEKDGAGFVEPL